MRKGTLCKVVKNGHVPHQLGDRVLLLSTANPDTLLFTGVNLRTNAIYYYYAQNLEVIRDSR